MTAWKSAKERLQVAQQTLEGQLSSVTKFTDADGKRWSSVGPISGVPYSLIEALLQGTQSSQPPKYVTRKPNLEAGIGRISIDMNAV